MAKGALPPFSCTYSPNLPQLMRELQCTLVVSTYQAGKVIFISPKDDEVLIQLPRTFDRAMGISVEGDRMAIATKDEVTVLVNAPGLAINYPKNAGVYDAMYMPRATYYTGQVDIHDLHWGTAGLWAVNTSFSCLALIDENYSWTPQWQPSFIDKLVSEDRCHLNGLAMQDGKPKFVTALGAGNRLQEWRDHLPSGGVLVDVESKELILKDLPMPHSPRLYNGELYMLLSAIGALVKIDVQSSQYEIIRKIDGFVRGMSLVGEHLFVAHSRLRQNSSTFKDLEIAKKAEFAGISIIHLPTGALVGEMKYLNSVDEIYDLQILPNTLRPGILNTKTDVHKYGLSIPGATYWAQLPKK